jgi:hypothetical protein
MLSTIVFLGAVVSIIESIKLGLQVPVGKKAQCSLPMFNGVVNSAGASSERTLRSPELKMSIFFLSLGLGLGVISFLII